MKRLLLALVVVALAAVATGGTDEQPDRVLRLGVSRSDSTGVGCNGSCVFSTSFTAAEGWRADATQFGTGCGAGFSGIQTGVGNHGAWKTGNGTCDSVIAAANWSGGAGGRGHRHYRGDGDNNQGGGLSFSLPAPKTQIWFSYMFRYSAGFRWSGCSPTYTKDWYWHDSGGSHFLIHGYQGGAWGFNTGGSNNYGGNKTWRQTYGGCTSDGTWHCFDAYHDLKTTHATIWIDGVRVFDSGAINYASLTNFSEAYDENQRTVKGAGGTDYYTDFDDLRLDDDLQVGQRIGCVGQSRSGAPSFRQP